MTSLSKYAISTVFLLSFGTLPQYSHGAERTALKERAASAQPVEFDVYVPIQNREQLERDLAELHDVDSKQYHQWLTPEQFASRYAATPAQLTAIGQQLAAYGMTSKVLTGNRIHVTAAANAVEQAFGTELRTGNLASGKSVIAATRPMTLTGAMSATRAVVTGLAGVTYMHTHSQPVATPQNRYRVTGPYWFDDLKQAYSFPSYKVLSGTGTHIAILGVGDFNAADMDLYFGHEKLVTPSFSTINVNGGQPFDVNGSFETHLDLQQSGGMAPNASVTLYNLPDLQDSSILAGLSQILKENTADVVSMSFGGAELFYTADFNGGMDFTYLLKEEDDLFAQGNAQGITFVASSGDSGALAALPVVCFAGGPNCGQVLASVEFPASSPHVTGVGGTNLITKHSRTTGNLDSTYVREEAYADPLTQDIFYGTSATGSYWGSGGGDSILFTKPAFQKLVQTGSKQFRTVPDLALHMGGCPNGAVQPCNPDDSADLEVIGGTLVGVIGTSASAPDFAGLTALTVERFGSRLGNVNYYVYGLALAQQAGLPVNVFKNNIPGFNGLFATTPTGYNRVLGNGTLNGIDFLLAPASPRAGVPQTPSNP